MSAVVGISFSTMFLWLSLLLVTLLCHPEGVQSFHLAHPPPRQQQLQLQHCSSRHERSTAVTPSSHNSSPSKSRVVLSDRRDTTDHGVSKSHYHNLEIIRSIRKTAVSALLGLSIVTGGIISGNVDSSMIANAASDPTAIVGCLFQKCSVQLGKCIASPLCLANVVCINTCNNRPDEIECQIKCGDIFDNPAIAEFNKCAVSDMSCVPQQQDTGMYPVPSRDVTVPKFNTNFFNGRLYITAGT
jgi:VDE lipocalin domain